MSLAGVVGKEVNDLDRLDVSMGYNIANWEMIRTREEFVEKLGLDGVDDTHTLLNNMVDVRACYKPSGKVRFSMSDLFLLLCQFKSMHAGSTVLNTITALVLGFCLMA